MMYSTKTRSNKCPVWTGINASRHAASVDATNCIILHSDLLHMVENLKSAYGTSWKSRKTSWKKIGQDIGIICLTLVDGSVCRNIPAESTKTWQGYVIYPTDDVNTGGADTERPRCFWMHMIIPGNRILAVKNDGLNIMQLFARLTTVSISPRWASTERQRSVNNFPLIISAIKGFHGHIDPKKRFWPGLDEKRQAVCMLPHPRNERQRSVTDF
jgi:hypothetical protein